MTTITCDRCGKEIVDVNYNAISINISGSTLDLCQECQNKLNLTVQKFIRGEDVFVAALGRGGDIHE